MTKANEKMMKKAAEMCNKKYESAREWAELGCEDNEKLEMNEWSMINNFCADLFEMKITDWIDYTCGIDSTTF